MERKEVVSWNMEHGTEAVEKGEGQLKITAIAFPVYFFALRHVIRTEREYVERSLFTIHLCLAYMVGKVGRWVVKCIKEKVAMSGKKGNFF